MEKMNQKDQNKLVDFKKVLGVHIYCASDKLYIDKNDGPELKIFNGEGNDVTGEVSVVVKNNDAFIELPENYDSFKILLPKKKYGSLNIESEGSVLTIGNPKQSFSAPHIRVDSLAMDCEFQGNLYINTSKIIFMQAVVKKGVLNIFGSANGSYIYVDGTDVNFLSKTTHPINYDIHTVTGDIDFKLTHGRVKPRPVSVFKKVQRIYGHYKSYDKEFILYLVSDHGKIKVY